MLGSAIFQILNVAEVNVKIYHLPSTRMEELPQVKIWYVLNFFIRLDLKTYPYFRRTSVLFVADSALCLITEPLADIL